jgi:ABC-type dipeptide/oligopeptide/nickel transport system permease component
VIPILALSIGGVAGWARFTRAFTLDVLKEDYVRTARSKGISEYRVMTRHVLRNALLPLSTMLGFALIGLFEGSFFVETLTGVPGYGRLAFESIGGRDYDMIMAITMLGASTFVIATIFIDIGYTLIDPRIRYGRRR